MAHEIDMTTGQAAIAYAGQTPWHQLGTKFDDLMTSQQALTAARLDWTVSKRPVYYLDDSQNPVKVDDRYVTVRSDTKAGLGTVGGKYTPVQNIEAFEFMDSLVAEGEMRYEVAGSLFGGRQVWMLAKLPSSTQVSYDDVIDHYLLISNGHDGLRGFRAAFTTVRVVCNNTLRLADSKVKHAFKIRHSGSIQDKLEEARTALGFASESFSEFGQKARAMSFKAYRSQAEVDAFIHSVIGIKAGAEPAGVQKTTKERIKALMEQGLGTDLLGVKGTYWGLLNAVTEFVDHDKPARVRSSRDEDEVRLESITFGGGDIMKQRAWDLALAAV